MPKKTKFFAMGMLLLVIAACNPKGGENKTTRQLLSKNIEYDVTINNYQQTKLWGLSTSADLWYRNNIESSVRNAYVDLLFKNAFAGKLEIFDINDKKIDTTELKKIMTLSDSLQIEIGTRLVDTVIKRNIDLREITALRFREEWTYDPATFAITKKVLALAPVRTPITSINDDETYGKSTALFWIKFPNEPSNTKVLTKRIMTNTIYYGQSNENNTKNADNAEISEYLNSLINRVCSDSIAAYSVLEEPACTQISGKELHNMLFRIDTVRFDNGKDTVIKREPSPNAIRFMEEWSFDPATMAIQKSVIGICPVSALYDADGTTFKGYQPYFWVYFKDVWTPFDGKLELKKLDTIKKK